MNKTITICSLVLMLLLAGCIAPRPDHTENICDIFQQYPEWYWDAKKTQDQWHVSIPIQMAIIYQESGFNANAQPIKDEKGVGRVTKIIRKIPLSTAYGYAQALNETWGDYEKYLGHTADRDEFATSDDFIGWYADLVNRQLHISLNDTYHLYLAYHEGESGYRSKSYWHKLWLIRAAHDVALRANAYHEQLKTCVNTIPTPIKILQNQIIDAVPLPHSEPATR